MIPGEGGTQDMGKGVREENQYENAIITLFLHANKQKLMTMGQAGEMAPYIESLQGECEACI